MALRERGRRSRHQACAVHAEKSRCSTGRLPLLYVQTSIVSPSLFRCRRCTTSQQPTSPPYTRGCTPSWRLGAWRSPSPAPKTSTTLCSSVLTRCALWCARWCVVPRCMPEQQAAPRRARPLCCWACAHGAAAPLPPAPPSDLEGEPAPPLCFHWCHGGGRLPGGGELQQRGGGKAVRLRRACALPQPACCLPHPRPADRFRCRSSLTCLCPSPLPSYCASPLLPRRTPMTTQPPCQNCFGSAWCVPASGPPSPTARPSNWNR